MKTIGIVADNYKLDAFRDELNKNGFADFTIVPYLGETSTIKVRAKEEDLQKLANVCRLVQLNTRHSN